VPLEQEPGGEARATGGRRRWRPGWLTRSRALWLGAYLVAGVALFCCFQAVSSTYPVPSDGASNALEAWDIMHGNPLLRGWTLTDVSFYTTELPEYMLVELIRGLNAEVVHVAAAVTYTLLVLLAGLLAKGRATGREAIVRILVASGIMIAPQLAYVHVLLSPPDHVGTGVPLLIIFIVLDRGMPSRRWWVPPAVGVLFTWVLIGDRIAITLGVIPLVAVCAIRAYQDRRAAWYEVSVAAASIVAVGAAQAVVSGIEHHGGFVLTPLQMQFAGTSAMTGNFWLTVEAVLGLYGADFFGLPLGTQAIIALVHLAGLALAIWGLYRATRRFFTRQDRIVQMLTLAIVLELAAFMFSTLPYTTWDARQVSAVLPFGAVLAGRLLAADLIGRRLLPVMAGLLGVYLGLLGYDVAQPAVPAHDQALADWLYVHHLTTGIAEYDDGNITTLASGGKVRLRVVSWQGRTAVPRAYQSKASWYDPRGNYANFVVNTTVDGPPSVIPYADIVDTFGPPAKTYQYGAYTIMVWHKNLFAELTGPPSRGIGNFP
jgi:hypothetical protein